MPYFLSDTELVLMACSDVKLACCRLCGQPVASNLGECPHCGVCKPVEKEKCSWLHWILLGTLISGTVLATLRYQPVRHVPDCSVERTQAARDC